MGCLDPDGYTGMCNAFSVAVHRADHDGNFSDPELSRLSDYAYDYLEGFAPFRWLWPSPDEQEPGAGCYWFRNYVRDADGNVKMHSAAKRKDAYEHRLTALAFMAAICRAGDAE